VPLRFLVEGFTFYDEDWNDPRDFTRIGRCVRLDLGNDTHPADEYDPTCDPYGWDGHGLHDRLSFSLRLEPLQGVTLGHGSLMFQYRNSRDLERPQLGVHSSLILYDWGSAEFVLDDITNPGVMAGHVELRPAILITGDDRDRTPDDLVVSVTYAGDFQAPLYRQTAFGRPLVDPQTGDARFTRDSLAAIGCSTGPVPLHLDGGPEAGLVEVFVDAAGSELGAVHAVECRAGHAEWQRCGRDGCGRDGRGRPTRRTSAGRGGSRKVLSLLRAGPCSSSWTIGSRSAASPA
jgi:hypothetical protein